ncbi:MAG: hypothetical protein M1469_04510 [Bacteroidetes bacterium]|nr:hypothetical protein [Bacteroidota bacterium]
MKLREALKQAKSVVALSPDVRVVDTVCKELSDVNPNARRLSYSGGGGQEAPCIRVGVLSSDAALREYSVKPAGDSGWGFIRTDANSNIEIYASAPSFLYFAFSRMMEDWSDESTDKFKDGRFLYRTFVNQRPLYDLFLTQHARSVEGFDRPSYFRTLARLGFTNAEVNGLAFPVPLGKGPKDEVYTRFYTYCPSLDQFVSSRLNAGTYDDEYLQANLNYLRTNAELAEKYGLTPGIVCFEPRSVPESLLRRYPMLRGARVDHPMRSFEPRYNLSIGHPVVREHYAEMMVNLMKAVPNLGYMSIWANDSGAGFEYTNSLYVGRNGGGYIVREWLGDTEVEVAAAYNIVRFMKLLRDAARNSNPAFRVLLRMEPFWVEHEHILSRLDEGLDLEVSSLQGKGWGLSYEHPKFSEQVQIHTTALHNKFDVKEKSYLDDLAKKGVNADVVSAPGIIWNHEPLIGITFPYLVFNKLTDMQRAGVKNAGILGGAVPEAFAPYNINQELVRGFQADCEMDPGKFLANKAEEWAGDAASTALDVWRNIDEAVRSFPIPMWIYAAWGVWYRLAVRPIVPNIDAIPEKERRYYEKFLLATPHNRCRVDFRYDVGFDLLAPDRAWRAFEFMDKNVIPPIDKALTLLMQARKDATGVGTTEFIEDQIERVRGLRSWMKTQRNVTAWVAGVHTYLESSDATRRAESRDVLRDMVLSEIENAQELLDLWNSAKRRWMIISAVGETTFVYYRNFGSLLKKKIELMHGHENDEPYVDPDYQWRLSTFDFSGSDV